MHDLRGTIDEALVPLEAFHELMSVICDSPSGNPRDTLRKCEMVMQTLLSNAREMLDEYESRKGESEYIDFSNADQILIAVYREMPAFTSEKSS